MSLPEWKKRERDVRSLTEVNCVLLSVKELMKLIVRYASSRLVGTGRLKWLGSRRYLRKGAKSTEKCWQIKHNQTLHIIERIRRMIGLVR